MFSRSGGHKTKETYLTRPGSPTLCKQGLNLPSNKAPGFDKIPARILKDSLPATLHIITSLMNNSFKSKMFARVWKIAEVTCVPKDGDTRNPCNSRRISLLPVLSKVNKMLAHRQFVKFLDDNNKLSQFQSGNRKHHSTETALRSVTDDPLKAMDEKKISILVLMNMSKFFESKNHDMLLFKLRSLGGSPSALEWFKSYLKGRHQYVRIGNVVSQSLPVDYGVPQGSILGPALFIVYINDLLTVPKLCQTACYIDDSKLYLKFKTMSYVTQSPLLILISTKSVGGAVTIHCLWIQIKLNFLS